MDVSIDNISRLNNNSSYYLSDDGQIKESGILHRFKCFFGIGHSRQRVANLVNAIKNTLINSSGGSGENQLTRDLNNLDLKSAVKGSAIKEFTANFQTRNKEYINRFQANNTAEKLINNTLTYLELKSNKIQNSDNLRKLLLKAVEKEIKNPPLLQQNGQSVVDLSGLKKTFDQKLHDLSRTLLSITNAEDLGKPQLTNDYADYLQEVLINKDGSLAELDLKALKKPDEGFSEITIKRLTEGSPEHAESCKAGVEAILRECKDDPDLRDIVLQNAKGIIQRGDNTIRTPEQITQKINDIKANLQELRNLSTANPKILAYGKKVLSQAAGKSFPAGAITKMAEVTSSANLSEIVKIKVNSTATEIHKAVFQFNTILANGLNNIDLGRIDGQDEKNLFRSFFTGMLCLRLKPEQRQEMRRALEGMEFSKVNAIYNSSQRVNAAQAATQQVAMLNGAMAFNIMLLSGDIHKAICLITGKETANIKTYVGEIDKSLKQMVKNDVAEITRQEAEHRINEFFKTNFKGQQAAPVREQIKDMMLNGTLSGPIYQVFEPQELFNLMVNNEAGNLVNLQLLGSMKKLSGDNPQQAAFFNEIGRLNVKLPGDKMLSHDPLTATNELAVFVTGREDAVFAELNEADKAKVRLVMSLLSQDTGKAITDAIPLALDKNKSHGFAMVEKNGAASYTFSLNKDQHGTIKLGCSYESEVDQLVTDKSEPHLKPDSKVTGSIRYTIRADELNRLAGLNYRNIDNTEAERILNEQGPEHQGEHAHNKLQKAMDSFPAEFKINAQLNTSYSLDFKD